MSSLTREELSASHGSCPKMVDTATIAWRCGLDPHEGPCAAVESPPSINKRDKWHVEKGVDAGVDAASVSSMSQIVNGLPMLNAEQISDPTERERLQLERLIVDTFDELPSWAQTVLVGQQAQASFATLFALAHAEFAKGAEHVIISKVFLDRLITRPMRGMIEALINQQT